MAGSDAKPSQNGKIPNLKCKFGRDRDGVELNAEIDLIKYDLICADQNFDADFCSCELTVEMDQFAKDFFAMWNIVLSLGYILLIMWIISIFVGAYHIFLTKRDIQSIGVLRINDDIEAGNEEPV